MHHMINTLKRIAVFFFLMAIISSDIQAQAKKQVAIIFDTDMGPDYDDAGAIAILHALADSGECRILATVGSNRSPWIAEVLSVMNTYFGRQEIPVGIVHEPAQHIAAYQKWDSLVVERYPHRVTGNAAAYDAVPLYRRLLSAQPDKSVTIVTVGFFTNLANLLASQPDSISSLDGKEMIRRKVKLLVSMAGRFDDQMGTFKEFNVVRDAPASVKVFDEWTSPILFSGFEIGARLHTGLPLVADRSVVHSPVKDIFAISIPMDPNDRNGRMSWDETAVLVAVRGPGRYFTTVKGHITGHTDGSNGWDAAGSRDAYLVQKMDVKDMEEVLNQLMMHQPVAR